MLILSIAQQLIDVMGIGFDDDRSLHFVIIAAQLNAHFIGPVNGYFCDSRHLKLPSASRVGFLPRAGVCF